MQIMESSSPLKIQTMEDLYKELFQETITMYGIKHFYFCGKKMYVKINDIIISLEMQGTEIAYNVFVLMAICKNGILDQNITPLKILIKNSKGESGQEKLVNLRVAVNVSGTYTALWTAELTEQDKMDINEYLRNYIELFLAFF